MPPSTPDASESQSLSLAEESWDALLVELAAPVVQASSKGSIAEEQSEAGPVASEPEDPIRSSAPAATSSIAQPSAAELGESTTDGPDRSPTPAPLAAESDSAVPSPATVPAVVAAPKDDASDHPEDPVAAPVTDPSPPCPESPSSPASNSDATASG